MTAIRAETGDDQYSGLYIFKNNRATRVISASPFAVTMMRTQKFIQEETRITQQERLATPGAPGCWGQQRFSIFFSV
jgi:hypothetical protein